MSTQYTLKVSPEQAKEMPMVDLAFIVLKAANTPYYYRDLMFEIAKIKGLTEQDVLQVIAQLYTEINIDGRFACVGSNLWGLKRWYPVERAEDAMGNAKRARIINDEEDDLDDEDLFAEEEDADPYTDPEEDEYDPLGEETDEIFAEVEEVDEEVDEDLIVDAELDESVEEIGDDLGDEDDLEIDEDDEEEDEAEDKK